MTMLRVAKLRAELRPAASCEAQLTTIERAYHAGGAKPRAEPRPAASCEAKSKNQRPNGASPGNLVALHLLGNDGERGAFDHPEDRRWSWRRAILFMLGCAFAAWALLFAFHQSGLPS